MQSKLRGDGTEQWAAVGFSVPLTRSATASFPAITIFVLGIWLLFNVYETVVHILAYYNPLPVWDYWRIASNIDRYKAFDFRVLFVQHNEHRIILPEIVFAADVLLWHGRQILPILASFVCYLSTWLLVSFSIFRDKNLPMVPRLAATLLAGVVIFWSGSATALAMPFLLQWTLLQGAVAASLTCLSFMRGSPGGWPVTGAIACAIIATYSSANGMLIWPVLLASGRLLQIGRRHMAALALSGLASIALYFAGYRFASGAGIHNLLAHPLYALCFVASYLGMPFGVLRPDWPKLAVVIGLINIVVMTVCSAVANSMGLLRRPAAVVLFGNYAFTLLSALLIASGRMDAGDPTFEATKVPRYLTVPLMNWALVILVLAWVSTKLRASKLAPTVFLGIMALLLACTLPKLTAWTTHIGTFFADERMAALSVEDGIIDPALLRMIYPDPNFVLTLMPEMRRNNLSIFLHGREKWIGKPAASFSRILEKPVAGQITDIFPVVSGLELVGWADDSELRAAYQWVILANERRQIVGFGKRLTSGVPAHMESIHAPRSLAWVGFANTKISFKLISLYVVDPLRSGLIPTESTASLPIARSGLLSLQ